MFFTSIIGCHCQSHPMSLLAPKRTSATSPRPPPLCTLCSCLHLHKGYPFLPGSTLHSCCSALHKVQSLTGCRQVEIQPLRCLSIWGNIMWSREEKGHDNFMQNNGKAPQVSSTWAVSGRMLTVQMELGPTSKMPKGERNIGTYLDVEIRARQVCLDYRKALSHLV